MVGLTVTLDEREVEPAAGWQLEWLDRRRGIARLSDGQRTLQVVVEGQGTEWFVTLRGRRVPITVRANQGRDLGPHVIGRDSDDLCSACCVAAGRCERPQNELLLCVCE